MQPRDLIAAGVAAGLLAVTPAFADDYTDEAYLEHDADNYTRARGAQVDRETSTTYTAAFLGTASDSNPVDDLKAALDQLERDVSEVRRRARSA